MGERFDKAKDWVGERGVPFESQLARMSDRLDEVRERREQKQSDEEDDASGNGSDEQDESSSAESESAS